MSGKRRTQNPHMLKARSADETEGEAWWYESERGIEVYQQVPPAAVTFTFIPWARLLAAAKRCGRSAR